MKKHIDGIKKLFKHADNALMFRLGIFCTGYLIILSIIIYDLFDDDISIYLALVGLAIGAFIAYLTRRMFITHWKAEKKKVSIRFDFSAVLSISLYIFFMLTRNWFFSQWVIQKNLDAIIFATIAGAMLARIIMIFANFNKIVEERRLK